MAVNKLIPYWITVREVEEPGSRWDQTNIHAEEPDFPHDNLADYFEEFCKKYDEEVHKNEDSQKTFTVDHLHRDGNTIEGVFKSGEWGRNADFWDIDEHTRIEDAREENHAEETPYYFLFHIPERDPGQALLILRKYKRKGIKTLFSSLFHPRQRDIDTGKAYLSIDPHYSDEIISKLDAADDVASIKFRGRDAVPAREKYADKNDIERIHDDISGQLEVGTEFKMSPKNNAEAFKQFAKGLVPGNKNEEHFDYGRIEEENFSSATVTIIEGESRLTFSLWKEQIQMRMDVDPDEHELDIYGGHPTPHSLGRVARQLANDLMNERNKSLNRESLIPRDIGAPDDSDETEIPAEND
jgi:hypothetical protein